MANFVYFRFTNSLGQTWGLRVKIVTLVFYVFLEPLGSQPFISRRILITFLANPSVRQRLWTPIFWPYPNLYWKMAKNDFLSFARKYSINGQDKLWDPYKAFWNHCGSIFSKKKIWFEKNFFGPPSQRKQAKKRQKWPKIAFLRPKMLLYVSITMPKYIILV